MVDVRHFRQQWPVGHGFFHTASIEASTPVSCMARYAYVYDCGGSSKNIIEQQIDAYHKNELHEIENDPVIDMLVISHFHRDHFGGISRLFEKFRIKKMVVPYLSTDIRLYALADLATHGPKTWTEWSGFVTNPRQWVAERNQETQIIEISEEDDESPLTEPTVPEDGDGFSIGNNQISHSSNAGVFHERRLFWRFKFYVQSNPELARNIISAIEKNTQITESSLKDHLGDPKWIEKKWKVIADVFKSQAGTNRNVTTLCMYSGPIEFRPYYASSSCLRFGGITSWWFRSRRKIGWLGTGDAELKSPSHWEAFKTHFGQLLECVDTVTVPHHGSEKNYNAKLGDIGCHHVITSNHRIDPKGHHPAPAVMINLATKSRCAHVVTQSASTAAFDRFEGVSGV